MHALIKDNLNLSKVACAHFGHAVFFLNRCNNIYHCDIAFFLNKKTIVFSARLEVYESQLQGEYYGRNIMQPVHNMRYTNHNTMASDNVGRVPWS